MTEGGRPIGHAFCTPDETVPSHAAITVHTFKSNHEADD